MDQRQATLETLIQPTVEGLGYDLVRVVVSGRQRPTLQVMAERRDRKAMTVEDCETISRAISAKLDVEDPLPGAYTLEVSSPGFDRVLRKPAHFERFVGQRVWVELQVPRDGRRRYTGTLAKVSDRGVELEVDGQTVQVAFADIGKARLVA